MLEPLAAEPRPATDAEARLQSPVLLPILQRCPHEQATDENGGQEDEEDKNDHSHGVHPSKRYPPKRNSSPTKGPGRGEGIQGPRPLAMAAAEGRRRLLRVLESLFELLHVPGHLLLRLPVDE
jgi:hypothetical protein